MQLSKNMHPRYWCENAHSRTNMRAPSSLVWKCTRAHEHACTLVTCVKMHTRARSCVHPRHLCENAHARTIMRAPLSLVWKCTRAHDHVCTHVTCVKMHTRARTCVPPRQSSLVLCENSHRGTIMHRDALVCKCTRVHEHAPNISDNIITFIICSYQKDEVDDDQQGDSASVSKGGPWHALGPPAPHPIDVGVQERAALGQLS